MADMKLDITSKVLEKSIDLAKEFLDKLISTAIEETGLLMKDQVSRFRFNNQLKILIKARSKCIKNNRLYTELDVDYFLADERKCPRRKTQIFCAFQRTSACIICGHLREKLILYKL